MRKKCIKHIKSENENRGKNWICLDAHLIYIEGLLITKKNSDDIIIIYWKWFSALENGTLIIIYALY